MEYEVFYREYQTISETLKTQLNNQMKLLKRINKYMETGDVKSAVKELSAVSETAFNSGETVSKMADFVGSADMTDYLSSGDFAAQLLEMCTENSINITGEGSNFEVFPYRLKIVPQEAELQINGKKAAGVRPKYLAEFLAKGRSKLLAASFNSAQFASELAAAYDLSVTDAAKDKKAQSEPDVYLTTLYKYLTPMRRFRREYDMQSFAFDIARLFDAENKQIADGRFFQFGPSRQNSKAIRIVDAAGNEHFPAVIRFYSK